MGSRYGHTAVVGGVVVGLVLAVLAVGGGSAADTSQTTESVLAASVAPAASFDPGVGTSQPPVLATTTTAADDAFLVAPGDRAEFCGLAADAESARILANRQDKQGPEPWLRQIEFLSVGATLVSPAAVDTNSGRSWRDILIDLSDRQSRINLELEALGWDLGAYLDTSSSGVVEAPTRLIVEACG